MEEPVCVCVHVCVRVCVCGVCVFSADLQALCGLVYTRGGGGLGAGYCL